MHHQPRQAHSAWGTHALMHPRSADMHATLPAEPHAPRDIIGGRSARPGRHAASELAAERRRCRRDGLHLLLFSASTAARRRSIRARPWTVAVHESSHRVAAWPHRR
eukprot:4503899-Prymnesium_polylepis.1